MAENEKKNENNSDISIGKIISIILISFLTIILVGIISAMTVPTLKANIIKEQNKALIKKSVVTAKQAVAMNKALGYKCEQTTEGTARCISSRLNVFKKLSLTSFIMADATEWSFNDKRIKIDVNGSKTPNIEGEDIIYIPYYYNADGYPEVDTSEIEKTIEKH